MLPIAGRHGIVAATQRVLAANLPVATLDCQITAASIDELVATRGDGLGLCVEDEAAFGGIALVDPLVVRGAAINGSVVIGPVGPKLRFWSTRRTLWEHGLRD